MAATPGRQFTQGLAAGALSSLVSGAALLYVAYRNGIISFPDQRLPDLGHWLDWAYLNLGASIPVFAILLLAYFLTISRLQTRLDVEAPVSEIIQLDDLADIWTTLFFGTGVIWTAIGMRSALIYSLGDPDAAIAQGAFALLQRMVEGGMLLALSTTIFGGVGGYLMRVYKAVSLGGQLQLHYDRAARVETADMRDTLSRIEDQLRTAHDVLHDAGRQSG